MLDQESRKKVAKLNERFGEFGRNPQGEYKFQWRHTTELYYFVLSMKDPKDWETVGLIATPTYGYERYEWAKLLGPRWNLCYWQHPVDYAEWVASGRGAFPWPKNGEFLCIENAPVPAGKIPTEQETDAAIDGIRFTFALRGDEYKFDPKVDHPKLRDYIAQQKQKIIDKDMAVSREIADDFDDGLPAHLKIPGSNEGNVSIPRPDSQIVREGGVPLRGE